MGDDLSALIPHDITRPRKRATLSKAVSHIARSHDLDGLEHQQATDWLLDNLAELPSVQLVADVWDFTPREIARRVVLRRRDLKARR